MGDRTASRLSDPLRYDFSVRKKEAFKLSVQGEGSMWAHRFVHSVQGCPRVRKRSVIDLSVVL